MKIDIKHFANLANLPITKKEEKKFEQQLPAILEHFKKISEISTDTVKETDQITGLVNIVRSDEIVPSLSQSEATVNTQNIHNNSFVVPVILEEGIKE